MTPGTLLYRCRRCHDVARYPSEDPGSPEANLYEALKASPEVAPATVHRCDGDPSRLGICDLIGADLDAVTPAGSVDSGGGNSQEHSR